MNRTPSTENRTPNTEHRTPKTAKVLLLLAIVGLAGMVFYIQQAEAPLGRLI